MNRILVAAMPMHNPPHPGAIIKYECLEPLGLTIARAARGLGVSRAALSDLVNGRAGLSVDMALRPGPSLWLDPGNLAGFADRL